MTKKAQGKIRLKDEVRGCEVTALLDEQGQVKDYGYCKNQLGEMVYCRIWPAVKVLELLAATDADYRTQHKVKNLDRLVADLDVLAYSRGVNLEDVFDRLWGGRGWRWTKAQRKDAGDGWREFWEPSDGVVELRFGF